MFYKSLDIAISQLRNRSNSLREICDSFRVLTPDVLMNANDDELFEMGQLLHHKYSNDISDTFSNELVQFRQCFRQDLQNLHTVMDLANFIVVQNSSSWSSFSKIVTACFLFLTIPVTVATAELSFSKLKLIKNYLRNAMLQDRFSSLAIISIENATARNLDVNNLIKKFACAKARKKTFT